MTRSHTFAETTVDLINTRAVTKDIHWMPSSTHTCMIAAAVSTAIGLGIA